MFAASSSFSLFGGCFPTLLNPIRVMIRHHQHDPVKPLGFRTLEGGFHSLDDERTMQPGTEIHEEACGRCGLRVSSKETDYLLRQCLCVLFATNILSGYRA